MAWNEPGGCKITNQDPWGSGGQQRWQYNGNNNGNNRGGSRVLQILNEALKELQDSLNGPCSVQKKGNSNNSGGKQPQTVGGGAGISRKLFPGRFAGLGYYCLLACSVRSIPWMTGTKAIVLRFGELPTRIGGIPACNLYFPPIERSFSRNVTQVRSYRQQGQMLN